MIETITNYILPQPAALGYILGIALFAISGVVLIALVDNFYNNKRGR